MMMIQMQAHPINNNITNDALTSESSEEFLEQFYTELGTLVKNV